MTSVPELDFTDNKETPIVGGKEKDIVKSTTRKAAVRKSLQPSSIHRLSVNNDVWIRAVIGASICSDKSGAKVSVSDFLALAIDAYLESNGIDPVAYLKKKR